MSYSDTFVGDRLSSFEYAAKNTAITGVNVILDDGTEVFVGSTGNVIDVSIPVCNSTVDATTYGNYILSALSSYHYQPYEAGGTILDPAMQLGDGITARSVYSGIYSRTTEFGRLMKASVSAPFEREVNNEYPYVSNYQRKVSRSYTRLEENMESQFLVQASEISAKVSKVSPTGQTSFSWAMNDNSHVWYSNGNEVFRLDSTGAHVKGEITATSGSIGIGGNFSVDSNGNMIANNATILGTLNVGGQYITAYDMYTGASQSAVNYGSWNTGTYYSYSGSGSYYNSIQSGTVSYPGYFKCGALAVTTSFMYQGYTGVWKSVTINGTTINYIGW